MLTLQKAKDYLRVTNDDEDALIEYIIDVAEQYVRDAVSDYDIKIKNDLFNKKADLVKLALVQNMFDERYFNGPELKENFVIRSMINQLEYGDYNV